MQPSNLDPRRPGWSFPAISALLLLTGAVILSHALHWANKALDADRKLEEAARQRFDFNAAIDVMVDSIRSEEYWRFVLQYTSLAVAVWFLRLLAVNTVILLRIRSAAAPLTGAGVRVFSCWLSAGLAVTAGTAAGYLGHLAYWMWYRREQAAAAVFIGVALLLAVVAGLLNARSVRRQLAAIP